ncbi:hypothetical protein DRO69_06705 [Candidatus Bathyarchaeota archaeon]|nr:MAG: hypothetical protein DRO69_06705 [Candidatus Bathyarchaeota archaeon]
MMKLSSLILLMLLLTSTLTLVFNIQVAEAEPKTWTVDDDGKECPDANFTSIQDAINAASHGDMIFVYSGTYYESIVVNKTVSLTGENPATTIIDGEGISSVIVRILAPHVIFRNFTVQNTVSGVPYGYGIELIKTQNVTVSNSIAMQCWWYGILLTDSVYCKILDNKIMNNNAWAICLSDGSSYNTIVGNLIRNNPTGLYIADQSCQNNTFYRNNIINNTHQVSYHGRYNSWDNGAEGNYWDDYNGTDLDGDGVGDTYCPHLGLDYRPLIEPWNQTRRYTVDSYEVILNCNYTIASFVFNRTLKQISFYITGPSGWKGFCNVKVPKGLLSSNKTASEKWIVMFGSTPLADTSFFENDKFTLISFNYTLGSSMSKNRVRLRIGVYYPPTADFYYTPSVASIIKPVNFTDNSIDSPNGTIVWRKWNLGDGTIIENKTFVSHQYRFKGLFNVTLTVKDNNTCVDSITMCVLVSNIKPIVNFTCTSTELMVGKELTFDASMSEDPDGNIVNYHWNFDDGSQPFITNETVATHVYAHAGSYNVSLTVWDNDGAENSTSQFFTVGKGVTEIKINAPATVKAKKLFEVNATLRDVAGKSLAGQQVSFYLYKGESTLEKYSSTTDEYGVAMASFSLNSVGKHRIMAEYEGSIDYLGSNNSVFITVNPIDTTLTLHAPEKAAINQQVTFLAFLMDEHENAISGVKVYFYLSNGSVWELLGSSVTNESGVASLNYTSRYGGKFMLKAVFSGSGAYSASSSNEYSFMVTVSFHDYTPYIIATVILSALVCTVFIYWKRKRKISE